MELGITGIHHVQIGVRPEDEAACRRFYGGILGMKEAPKPVPLRKNGGAYFYLAGIELHLSLEETPENAASGQHVCFELDDLARAEAALRAGGGGDRSRPPAHRGVGAVLCARSGGGPGRVRPGAAGLSQCGGPSGP